MDEPPIVRRNEQLPLIIEHRAISHRRPPKKPSLWPVLACIFVFVLSCLAAAIAYDEYRRFRNKQEAEEAVEKIERIWDKVLPLSDDWADP